MLKRLAINKDYLSIELLFSRCHVQLFVTPGTVACQAPLSVGFYRQEYWNRLPFPTPGDLSDSGTEPVSLASAELAGGFFTLVLPGKPQRM